MRNITRNYKNIKYRNNHFRVHKSSECRRREKYLESQIILSNLY